MSPPPSPKFVRYHYVEQSVVFYLKPTVTSRSPKNQNGTVAKDALLMEKFVSAECVRSIRRGRELCGLADCASSPICNRTLIGQRVLVAANG